MAFPLLVALPEIPTVGWFATDTRTVLGTHPLEAPKHVSRTKISSPLQAGSWSSGVRFVEIEPKDTNRPSALRDMFVWFPGLPPPLQLPIEPSLASATKLVRSEEHTSEL